MEHIDFKNLEKHAYQIRRHIVHTIATNGEGHAGGALSVTDILSVLYFGVMQFDADDPIHSDKLLLSAGHKCLALYGALVEKGIVSEAELKTYNQLGTIFPGHPDATKLKGVTFSTGSLGHGLPLGCGYALAAKRLNLPYRTYVVMGDGEQGEGSIWEAVSFAAKNCLGNLIAVIDENSLQINGRTYNISKHTHFQDRYASYGWSVGVVDGHNVEELYKALTMVPFSSNKPTLIVAKTIKGKGLSFLEDDVHSHHWNPGPEQAKQGIEEIDDYGRQRGWL